MLNDRTREILEFVRRFKREKGLPPTIREIGEAFGIASTNGVRYHLALLEKAGFIRRRSKISRGIEAAASQAEDAQGIPILGRVAAGEPITAEQNWEGRLDTRELFGDLDGLFALRVRGDSMIGAGIFENDYVVVRRQDHAQTGEIIVALLDDEATVKTYQPRKDRIELIPENPDHDPIVVPRDGRFQILGLVKGVVRVVGR